MAQSKTLANTYNTGTAGDTNPSTGSTNFASYASILTSLESEIDTNELGDVTLSAGMELALNDLVAYLNTTRENADSNTDAQDYVKSGSQSDSAYFGKNWYYLLEITDFLALPAELQSLLEAVDGEREGLTGDILTDTTLTINGSFREIVILLALYSQAVGVYIPDVDKLVLKHDEANSVSVRDGATLIEIDTTEANDDTSSPIKDARLKSQEKDTNDTSGEHFHANDFGLYYVNAAEKVNLIYPASFNKENQEEHKLIMVLIKENGDEQEIDFTVLVRDRTAPNSPTIDATLYAEESQLEDSTEENISSKDGPDYTSYSVEYDEPVNVTVHDESGESSEVVVESSDNKTFTLKIKRTRASLAGRTISGLYLKAVDRDTHYNLASYTNRFDVVFYNKEGTIDISLNDITHSQILAKYQDTNGTSNITVLTVTQDSNEDDYSMSLDSVTGPNSEDAIGFFTQDGLKVDLNLTDTNKLRNEFLTLRGEYSIRVTVTEAHDTNSSDSNLPRTHTVTKVITITDNLAISITQDTNNFTEATYVGGTFADTTASSSELFIIPAFVFDAYGDAASVSVKADSNQDGDYVNATLDSNGEIAITTDKALSLNHLKNTYTFTLLINDDPNGGDTSVDATELQVRFSTSDDSAPEIDSLESTLASVSAGGSTNINPVPMKLKLKNNEKMSDMTTVTITYTVAGGSTGNATNITTGDDTEFLISLQSTDDGKVVTVTATVKKDSLTEATKTFSYTYDISVDNSFAFADTNNKEITISNRTEYSVLEVTDFVVGSDTNNNSIDTSEYIFGHSGFSDVYESNVTSEKHYTFYTFTDSAGNVAALVQEILVQNFGAAAGMVGLAAEIGSLSKEVNVTLPSGNSYALSSDTNNDNSLFTLDTNNELTLNASKPTKAIDQSYSLEIVATNDASQNTKTSTLTVTVKTSGKPTLTIAPVVTSLDSADTNTPVKIADVSASFTGDVSSNEIALFPITIESVVGTYRTGYADEQFPGADSNKDLKTLFSINTNGDLNQVDDLDDAVTKVTITLKVAATLDSTVSTTATVVFTVNDTTTPVLKFKDAPADSTGILSYTKNDDESAEATFTHGSTLNMDYLLDVSESLQTTTGITTSISLSGVDNTAESAPASLTELTSTLGTFAVKQTRKDDADNTSNEVTLTITIVRPATIDLVDLNAEHDLETTLNVDGLYKAPTQAKLPEVRLDMKASAFNELFTVTLPGHGINTTEKLWAERIYVQEEMTFGVDAGNKLPNIEHVNSETIAQRIIHQGHVTESDKKFLIPDGASKDNFDTDSYANLATFTYVMELMEGVEGLEEATNYTALRDEIMHYFANDTNGSYKQDIIDILDDSSNPTNNEENQETKHGGNRKNFAREVFFQILKAELAAGGNGPRLTKKGMFKTAMEGLIPLKYAINFQEGDTLTFTVKLTDADGEHQYGQDTNTNTNEVGNTDDLAAADRQVIVKINMKK